MKAVVLLVLVGLVADSSYTLLISEGETQPAEEENRLKRHIFLGTGSYILRQDLDGNDYEGMEDNSENKRNNDEGDDVENRYNEERTFENSVNDFERERTYEILGIEVADPFRRPRSRRQGGRRRRRRQGKSRLTSSRRRRQWRLRGH